MVFICAGDGRVVDAKPSATGKRTLASFDLRYAGLRIFGCSLVEMEDGSMVAHGPRGKDKSGRSVTTLFHDPALGAALTQRAVALYEGFTGQNCPAR